MILEDRLDPFAEFTDPISGSLSTAPFRSLGEQITGQVHGRHHGEIETVDRSRSVSKSAHRLFDKAGDALQLGRIRLRADPVLLAKDPDRDDSARRHGLGASRDEAEFDLVDLAH